jgi:hypothetical protein
MARCAYDGLSLVAEHGFVNPTWNAGMLVVLDDGSGDILIVWKGHFSVRFTRVRDEDLDGMATRIMGLMAQKMDKTSQAAAGHVAAADTSSSMDLD